MINTIPLTISEIQEKLKNKDFSVMELTESYLDRINRLDKDINSFVTVSSERAFEDAKRADDLISQVGDKAFEDHPLLGACVGYKDLFLTKGIRTTAGSKLLESYVPVYSGTAVKRLEDAGTVMIGKVNCDAWAHGSSGENSDFGPTKNPWNRDFTPGGSSSGSGASLAANFCTFTTGTDTCGSIRLPANYSGVVGFKPTYGVVPRYGVIAMASSLDCVGHLTHSTLDTERIFKITSGKDNFDSTIAEGKSETKEKLTIGIPKEFFVDGLDREVESKVKEAIKVFESMGIEIKEVSLPHTKYGISVYYIIQPAEVSSNLGRYDGIRYGLSRDTFGEEAKRRIMLGSYVLSSGYYDAYYLKAMKVRTIINKEVDDVFNDVDVMIAPVAPTPPFKIGEKINDPLKMYLNDILAATANLSGIPSLALPFGFTQKGLPLGFQIMAPRFGEERLFKLGKMFEKETGYKPEVAKI
jgi:aspartyl-tRNA(Asn)/glutamyl-tRNA(Gln) amidotransferase subunit A